MSTNHQRAYVSECGGCGVIGESLQSHPTDYDGRACTECVRRFDIAAQALADSAWLITRESSGRFRPRCWIQTHGLELMRVSYAGSRPDEWLAIASIAAVEEI